MKQNSIFPLIALALANLGAPPASAAEAPEPLVAAVTKFAAASGETAVPSFRHALADLNGDAKPDAVVLLTSPTWCGTGGCTLLVLEAAGAGFRLVGSSSVTDAPIRLAKQRSHGWSSLIVRSRGRGDVTLKFGRKAYPGNPSLQPRASKASLAASTILLE